MVGPGGQSRFPPLGNQVEIKPAADTPISRGGPALQLCAVESGWAGFDVEDFAESP
jgi:hypothetical protein